MGICTFWKHLYLKYEIKTKPFYCYSEEERDKAIAKLKKGVEITRFKGLGEISAS